VVLLELGGVELGEHAAEGGEMDGHPVLFDRGGTDRLPLRVIGPGPPDINVGFEDDARTLKIREGQSQGRKLTGSTITPEWG
jgi:hypothetical protein